MFPLDYFFSLYSGQARGTFWRAASRRLSRPAARQLERRSCIFNVNQKSWADRSSLLRLARGQGKNVARSGEKDGKPAETTGSHAQRAAVRDQRGEFAGKFTVLFHECLMRLEDPFPSDTEGKKERNSNNLTAMLHCRNINCEEAQIDVSFNILGI